MAHEITSLEAGAMGLNDCKDIISTIMRSNDPRNSISIMVWGPPGCGKSDIINQAAQEWEEHNRLAFRNKHGLEALDDPERKGEWTVNVKDVRLLLLNPVDLRGIPVPDRERKVAQWLSAGFLPQEDTDGKQGILFLDEINAAPQSVQAAAYQIVLDRKCGEYTVPPGWKIVCAGNRMGDRGVVNKMPSPLANRMIHLEVSPSVDDWKKWAFTRGSIHPEVISFLAYKADKLYKMPTGNEEIRAFPTPRSWTFASKMLYMFGGNTDKLTSTMIACVGAAATQDFMTFRMVYSKLPNIEGILTRGTGEKPDDTSVMWALAAALIAHVAQTPMGQERIKKLSCLLQYMNGLPHEYQIFMAADIMAAGLDENIQYCGEHLHTWARQILPGLREAAAAFNTK